jgi:hypothetical protein
VSEAPPPPPKSARRRRWLWVAAAALLLIVFHAPLLRVVGRLPVINAPHAEGDLLPVRVDFETLAAVGELFAAGRYERVLIVPNLPRHTDSLGITEPTLVETRRELAARGVPDDRIDIVGKPTAGFRSRVDAACEFVRRHPEKRVTFVTLPFEGRAVRSLAVAALGDEAAKPIAQATHPAAEFDSERWWTARIGVQTVFRGYLRWAMAAWFDEPPADVPPIDWGAFEAAIARGEKP